MTITTPHPRVAVDGKFFRAGERKFYPKGVTYGPFAPNDDREMFPSREQVARDLKQIQELGANLLRVYDVPPAWLLDLASEHGLRVLVDIPWPKHLCFLDSAKSRAEAREAVREAVRTGREHPAIFAYSVVNEIPPDIVRWSGAREVADFIDDLVAVAKSVHPDALCTFTSFPPTEFLRPEDIDFVCFNVYLHHRKSYENYLARLQTLADAKPLVLGEFGLDSIREGETQKCEALAWQIESAFRAGLAGTVVFSFTDDWHRGGRPVEDWAFGLTTRQREPKPSFAAVQQAYRAAPYFPLARSPKVSVIVACYNGARTLKACLDSLTALNYPDYEVILVDDGSTDATPQVAQGYARMRYVRQDNLGLSVARNTGIAAATGEIVAFTDADCRADEDWLYYLVGDLVNDRFAGIGGHNFLPPEDSLVAAAVVVSPGGPAHVMLTDREAEHVPGCNMAFYKWALEEIGGFDPMFRKAGDDVDVCWRLQERGHVIGFSHAGFVWHYRRSTMPAYLKQQSGYGEAEALLARKHPEHFNLFGGGIWRGRIYAAARFGVILQGPIIYHGLFGSGFFQKLYASQPAPLIMFCTALEFHVLVTLPLLVLAVSFAELWPVALASVAMSLAVCVAAAAQAELPKRMRRVWSRPLVALLYFLQPIVRGWARYQWRLNVRSTPEVVFGLPASAGRQDGWEPVETVLYWSQGGGDRYVFLHKILTRLDRQGWQNKPDLGWSDYDVEIFGNRWSRLRLTTVMEELGRGNKMFRCRLHATWSLRARIAFWASVGLDILLIGLLAKVQPWLWMILLGIPIFGWYLEQEKRNVQQWIGALLDDAARESNFVRVPHQPDPSKTFVIPSSHLDAVSRKSIATFCCSCNKRLQWCRGLKASGWSLLNYTRILRGYCWFASQQVFCSLMTLSGLCLTPIMARFKIPSVPCYELAPTMKPQGSTGDSGPGLWPQGANGYCFSTTHWSIVLAAGNSSAPGANESLEKLCHTYWYPVYAWVRRKGRSPEDAQDLTQEFFARLLEKRYLRLADRNRGRFRTFLLTALDHFLVNDWRKANAEKRGAGQTLLSLHQPEAEGRYQAELASPDPSPDLLYERRWALTLLEQVLQRLGAEYEADGRKDLFDNLKSFVWGEESSLSQAEIGARLGMRESAVSQAVHRMRQRYGALLRAEVANTVAAPGDVEDELRHLLQVISIRGAVPG